MGGGGVDAVLLGYFVSTGIGDHGGLLLFMPRQILVKPGHWGRNPPVKVQNPARSRRCAFARARARGGRGGGFGSPLVPLCPCRERKRVSNFSPELQCPQCLQVLRMSSGAWSL